MDMKRIRLALAKPADRTRISEEQQRDETGLANARRLHDDQVRTARASRSTARRRWATPPDGA